jgi:hypothetical protein
MSGKTPLFERGWRNPFARGAFAAVLAIGMAGCASEAPTVTGPSGPNKPPVIQSLVAGSPQIEVADDQTVQLTATVTDPETSPTQLSYDWSTVPTNGTFIGAGPQVRWKPSSLMTDPIAITLTVVENFASGSTLKENRVSSTAPLRFNEMIISGLVSRFLTDFGTYSVSPTECVRNFSDSCSGKAAELKDIQDNRRLFHIESATFNPANFILTLHGTTANIDAPCTFKDNKGTTTGHCLLTAIYQVSKWWLCDSNFQGNPLSGSAVRAGGSDLEYAHRVP